MRFWPGWPWLRERIRDQAFGPLRSLSLQRLCARPGWSPEFYCDDLRSGGALFDLHIHDADFVFWSLGPPQSVQSQGSSDHLIAAYHYRDGPDLVMAEGGWDQSEGFPFRMRYIANFERATAEFDFLRQPPLMLSVAGVEGARPVELPAISAYEVEVRHALDAVTARRAGRAFELVSTLEGALASTRMLEAERRSLLSGASVAMC
jgi:predicted dehydrogenase